MATVKGCCATDIVTTMDKNWDQNKFRFSKKMKVGKYLNCSKSAQKKTHSSILTCEFLHESEDLTK